MEALSPKLAVLPVRSTQVPKLAVALLVLPVPMGVLIQSMEPPAFSVQKDPPVLPLALLLVLVEASHPLVLPLVPSVGQEHS